MVIKRVLSILILTLTAYSLGSPSEAGVIFLNIEPGGRPTGMGNAFAAVADDATATWWNPAGLGRQEGREISFMHVNWLPGFGAEDIYFEFLAYKQEIEGLGVIGGNIVYFNLGEQRRTSEFSEDEGVFNTYETAITLSYGTSLTESMYIGMNTKFIYSHLSDQGAGEEKGSGTGTSIAIDLGFLYETEYDIDFGASLSNLGPKVSYIDYEQADPLPTNLRLGLAYYAFHDDFNSLVLTADMSKLLVKRGKDLDNDGKIQGTDEWNHTDPIYKAIFTSWTDRDGVKDVIWGIGMEYWYSQMLGLRFGHSEDKMGKIFSNTYGASIRFSDYIVDFSYLDSNEESPVSGTMRFSLNVLL